MSRRFNRRLAALILAAAGAITATANTVPAAASTGTLQAEIDQYLATHPGGTQISAHDISYDGGIFVVTLGRQTSTSLVADCPSGWFCFYDATDYQGNRGKLSSCGWQDLARWFWNDRVVSAYYNTGKRGTVDFIDHAKGFVDHSHDVKLFSISSSSPGLRQVPSPNRADHVNYHC
jgi:hypothetical protein